jgi:SAM-dependent methyltransferase
MRGMRGRFFAAIYDRLFAAPEEAGLRELRAELLRRARGRTLEVGAGTGLNLPHYGADVTELVLTEPDPHMAKRLRAQLPERGSDRTEVIEATAEGLPFPDASFETVVSGLVLCSVAEPAETIEEIARVLRPGGTLLFFEHVRAPDGSRLAGWQDRLERPWSLFAGGCHPNRRTVETLEASPLRMESLEIRDFPTGAAALVRPLAVGAAVRAAAGPPSGRSAGASAAG